MGHEGRRQPQSGLRVGHESAAESNHGMSDLQAQIQKPFTLNWLIQGASQPTGITFHHLVANEPNALQSELLPAYDKFALINLLQYWQPEVAMIMGRPRQFWERAATESEHPFFGHPLLAKYGGSLSEFSRRRGLERSKEKGVSSLPGVFTCQVLSTIRTLALLENPHRMELVRLAKRTASVVWGITLGKPRYTPI